MKFTPEKIEQVETDALIPYARNSRTHSEAQVSQIAGSIKEFGFTNPVLIDGERGIIAGHGRVLAAKKLGLKQVPCIKLDHLTDTQRRAYVIADNKIALNSGWDEELLKVEMQEIDAGGLDLTLTGFNEVEIASFGDDVVDGVEWDGMPEFESEDKSSFRKIIVHFDSENDVNDFFKKINHPHTEKTKSIWHPEKKRKDFESLRYV